MRVLRLRNLPTTLLMEVTVTHPIPRKSTSGEKSYWGTVTQMCQEKMSHTGARCKTEALIQTARKA